jgi:hypothetical protein
MTTVPVEQTDAVLLIAKEHEFFAQHVDRHRRTTRRKLARERDRLPIAA